jgi:hypothetical protein
MSLAVILMLVSCCGGIKSYFRRGVQAIAARLSESKLRPYIASRACARASTGATMTISRAGFACILLSGLLLMGVAQIWPARAQYVGREQDVVNLRLGQRVMVDDGTCPAGQVKEVSGAKMTPTGVMAAKKCIPRLGPKKK